MIHPYTEIKFINHTIGYGLVAKQLIPKGTITWVMDKLDQSFTYEEIIQLGPAYKSIIDTYTFRDSKGNYILCWDNARFVNHSFSPNCITTAYDFELAVRDIHPGEELTNDYGTLNITEPFYCKRCDRTERNAVLPDDLVYHHEDWDRQLYSAFDLFNLVNQPLAKFLSPKIYKKAQSIGFGKCKMDSILSCYYHDNNQVDKKRKVKSKAISCLSG